MSSDQEALRDALKRAASALSTAEVPYALGGSYALWVYGAPEPTHDVDLLTPTDHVEHAAAVLADAGFDIDRPPEGWLLKATSDGAVVDVLHALNGVPVTPDTVAAAETQQVLAVWMPVVPPTDVIIVKLRTLDEHYCDFGYLLPIVRAVREQLDWTRIEAQTSDNDFAVAFLVLARRLGIAPGQ
jgi:hypothetical protein